MRIEAERDQAHGAPACADTPAARLDDLPAIAGGPSAIAAKAPCPLTRSAPFRAVAPCGLFTRGPPFAFTLSEDGIADAASSAAAAFRTLAVRNGVASRARIQVRRSMLSGVGN